MNTFLKTGFVFKNILFSNRILLLFINMRPKKCKIAITFMYKQSCMSYLYGGLHKPKKIYFPLRTQFNVFFLLFFLFVCFATLGGLWDLSFPMRDWTHAPWQWKHRILTIGLPGSFQDWVYLFQVLTLKKNDGGIRLRSKQVSF